LHAPKYLSRCLKRACRRARVVSLRKNMNGSVSREIYEIHARENSVRNLFAFRSYGDVKISMPSWRVTKPLTRVQSSVERYLPSILKPILFSIDNRPLEQVIKRHYVSFHIYTDETQLYFLREPFKIRSTLICSTKSSDCTRPARYSTHPALGEHYGLGKV